MAESCYLMDDLENALKMSAMSFLIGHEISDNDMSASARIMRAAVEVTVKTYEKLRSERDEGKLKQV